MLKYREHYNKKLKKNDSLEIGDLVQAMKETPVPGSYRILNNYWEEPYEIIGRIGNVCYKLIDPMNPDITFEKHARKLKRFTHHKEWMTDTEGVYDSSDGSSEDEDAVSDPEPTPDHRYHLGPRIR